MWVWCGVVCGMACLRTFLHNLLLILQESALKVQPTGAIWCDGGGGGGQGGGEGSAGKGGGGGGGAELE